jgi:hypothetical protein
MSSFLGHVVGSRRSQRALGGGAYASYCRSIAAVCRTQSEHRGTRPEIRRLQIMPRITASLFEKSFTDSLQH